MRRVRIGRVEEALLLSIVVLGGSYPMLREAFPSVVPILCGLPTPDGTAITDRALAGKVICTLFLAVLLPFAARFFAGSWLALTRSSAVRSALVVASVTTTMLTAYDACTGFHATQRTSEGCACWLTALVAGLTALAAALLILAGRAIARMVHQALIAIVEAVFQLRRAVVPPFFGRGIRARVTSSGVRLARRHAGRGPPMHLPLIV